MSKLRQWLLEPRLAGIDVDDNKLLELHGKILLEKRLLQSAFLTFYENLSSICDNIFHVDGIEIELGSGAGFFKKVRKNIITSDIRKSPKIDRVINAMHMDMLDESIRCLYAINVFHHLPSPDTFFQELIRVVKPGGGCILVEPHNGFFSAWVHKRLHNDEYFDTEAPGWQTSISGPLSGANQAMAHIVFKRDIETFYQRYGAELELVSTQYVLNAFRYLLSGGLNFRSLAPAFMEKPLRLLEQALKPFARHWSLHNIIVLKKREKTIP